MPRFALLGIHNNRSQSVCQVLMKRIGFVSGEGVLCIREERSRRFIAARQFIWLVIQRYLVKRLNPGLNERLPVPVGPFLQEGSYGFLGHTPLDLSL